MSGWIELGSACVLLSSTTVLEPTDAGWQEQVTYELLSQGGCRTSALHFDAGTTWTSLGGKRRLGDATGGKLGPDRFDIQPSALDGTAEVRVLLPELLSGDRAFIEVTREWRTDGGVIWTPARDAAAWAELSFPRDASPVPAGKIEGKLAKGEAYLASPEAGDTLTIGALAPSLAEVPPTEGAPLVLNRELTLSWEGDPAYELAPGRSSRLDALDELAVPADVARRVVIPVPAAADGLAVEGEGVEALVRPGSVLLDVEAGAERVIALRWGHPDAPTYGERPVFPGLIVDQQVRADGTVRWEDGAWWLASAEGTGILPSREALLMALEYRFGVASYPEPGLPAVLRGRRGGWELFDDVRSGIAERARVGPLVREPLQPRGLMKARRSGVLTEVEAALLVTRWAQTLGMDATWTLVRPASRGPGPAVSPAGYDHGLVRVVHEGELRWMDPGCTVCATWEVRPDLEGAAALGWEIATTRAPTPGSLVVEATNDGDRYTLEGSAALALRLALQADLPADRSARLLDALSKGGVVTSVEGLAEAGAPVVVTIAEGTPRLIPAGEEGAWMGWVGTRTVPSAGPDASFEGEALAWARTTTDAGTTETLTVRERRLSRADLDALEAARAAPPVEPEPEPLYTAEEIAEAVKAVLPAVSACPDPPELVTEALGFSVDAATGTVTEVALGELEGPWADCARAALGELTLPADRGPGSMEVRYPLR